MVLVKPCRLQVRRVNLVSSNQRTESIAVQKSTQVPNVLRANQLTQCLSAEWMASQERSRAEHGRRWQWKGIRAPIHSRGRAQAKPDTQKRRERRKPAVVLCEVGVDTFKSVGRRLHNGAHAESELRTQVVDKQQSAPVRELVPISVICEANKVRPERAPGIAGVQPDPDAIKLSRLLRIEGKTRGLRQSFTMTLRRFPTPVLSGHENLDQLGHQCFPSQGEVRASSNVDRDAALLVVTCTTIVSVGANLDHEGDPTGCYPVEPRGDRVVVPLAGCHQRVTERLRGCVVKRLIELEGEVRC